MYLTSKELTNSEKAIVTACCPTEEPVWIGNMSECPMRYWALTAAIAKRLGLDVLDVGCGRCNDAYDLCDYCIINATRDYAD